MPHAPLIPLVEAVKQGPCLSHPSSSSRSIPPPPSPPPLSPPPPPSPLSPSLYSQKLFPVIEAPSRITEATSDVAIAPIARESFISRLKTRLYVNRGLLLILIAQFFGSLMSMTARLLETGPQKFHAIQILFARQSITAVGCFIWMWWNSVPNAPLGPKGVRWLLVIRGVGGFWGVFGLYYSLTYLGLADATVITFLAPVMTTWACSIIPALREPFTRHEFLAGVVSFLGVVFIARPASLFSRDTVLAEAEVQAGDEVTPSQRILAVLAALVGVLGAACAYTTIRWIGKRAHPLITVNYFATWCTVVTFFSLLFIPQIGGIIWPTSPYQWLLLIGIGVSGFVMQFLLTSGLQLEKAGRGTNMIYTQMLFALFWERMVWGTTPGWLSIVGSGLILSSAVWVGTRKVKKEVEEVRNEDEEVGLMDTRRSSESNFVDEDGSTSG